MEIPLSADLGDFLGAADLREEALRDDATRQYENSFLFFCLSRSLVLSLGLSPWGHNLDDEGFDLSALVSFL